MLVCAGGSGPSYRAAMDSSARAHSMICAVGGTPASVEPGSLPLATHSAKLTVAAPHRTLPVPAPGGAAALCTAVEFDDRAGF